MMERGIDRRLTLQGQQVPLSRNSPLEFLQGQAKCMCMYAYILDEIGNHLWTQSN